MNVYTLKKLSCFLLLPFCILMLMHHSVLCQEQWRKYNNPDHELTYFVSPTNYAGASIIDINNDGHSDIFFAPKTFFLNDGKGNFLTQSTLPFNPLIAAATGSSWADIDNDGDMDCIIATFRCRVFVNLGNGNFADSTSHYSHLTNYHAFGCAIGDMDGDAYLDFTFAHANTFHPNPQPGLLLVRKENDKSAHKISGYHFTDNLEPYTNPYWSDYDMDGDMDLFVATGPAGKPGKDFCYKNLRKEIGKDSLVELEDELFAQQLQDGQCYNFIDYDNDGDLDLCLTNYWGAQTRLYKNAGNQIYQIVQTPFSQASTNLANCWGDYDNDGDLDIIITNDNQITKYYRNDGNDIFTYQSDNFSTGSAICSVSNGDIDNDGDLDIVVNGKGNNGSEENAGLYINEGVAKSNAWVQFSLKAIATNSTALGTFATVYTKIKGMPTKQLREINVQNTFQGQNSPRLHFGLGDAQIIDSIVIQWKSGMKQTITSIPVNKIYTIAEGEKVNNIIEKFPSASILFYDKTTETVRLPKLNNNQNNMYRLSLMNIMGEDVKHGVSEQFPETFAVNNLPNGYYVLIITAYNGDSLSFVFTKY